MIMIVDLGEVMPLDGVGEFMEELDELSSGFAGELGR